METKADYMNNLFPLLKFLYFHLLNKKKTFFPVTCSKVSPES